MQKASGDEDKRNTTKGAAECLAADPGAQDTKKGEPGIRRRAREMMGRLVRAHGGRGRVQEG